MLIGLIADTHGYLDPRAPPALKGVELILHAGDIGAEGVLSALASIAPVTAVAGNNDAKLAQLGLPLRVDMELEGVKLHLVRRPFGPPVYGPMVCCQQYPDVWAPQALA